MVKYVGKEVETLGVCNFSAGQSTQLLDFCLTSNIPRTAVVQNELHPLLLTREVRDLCKRVGIVSQVYSSLRVGSQAGQGVGREGGVHGGGHCFGL